MSDKETPGEAGEDRPDSRTGDSTSSMPPKKGSTSVVLLLMAIPAYAISDYWIVYLLACSGYLAWTLAARLHKKPMSDPAIARFAWPAMVFLIGFGLLMPRVSWLPCPSWVSRSVVKQADYRAMEKIFGKPLPESFHISQVNYPGYNLLFNGPDGPNFATYEVLVDEEDFEQLTSDLAMEVLPQSKDSSPAGGPRMLVNLQEMHNGLAVKLGQDPLKNPFAANFSAFKMETPGGKTTVGIDRSEAPKLKVYVSTRVPYSI